MKKALLSIASLCLIVVIIVDSCQKPYNNNGSIITVSSTSLNQLFSDLRWTTQGLSVTARRDTTVFGTNGTVLHFYTNSFKDASGNIITSGTVNLQLVEMYKPGDMIANRATTIADGQILQSGGQISIVATMNSQTVYANKYSVGFAEPAVSYQPMALFYGGTGNADSVATWTKSDSLAIGTTAQGTTNDSGGVWGGTTYSNHYIFDSCTNFTYTNCDQFYNTDSPKTSVSIVFSDTSFNPNNTEMYLVLTAINSVMSNVEPYLGGANYNKATKTLTLISEGNTDIVPRGMAYKMVVIAKKNDTYYYWETSGNITANMVLNTAMATSTSAAIKTSLAAL